MKRKLLLLFLTITISLTAFTQLPPDTIWTKTYGSLGYDDAISIIETYDSCFVILGHTDVNGSLDVWLLKIDNSGNVIWDYTFGGDYNNIGRCIKEVEDKGLVFVGTSESDGNGNKHGWLVKTNQNGIEEWNSIFGDTFDNTCDLHFLSQTTDNGFILSGGTGDYYSNQQDVWMIKTDQNGNEEWNN